MKFVTKSPIASAAVTADINSSPIDTNQIIRMSAQVVVSSGTATGSLKLQVSNDAVADGKLAANVAPTNWSDLGSAVTITASGTGLIAQQEMCYRWLRAVYTDTTVFANTITAVADVAGSLNSTYFLIASKSASYYVWFDNGTGVDPAIAGRTAVHVTYTTNDSASTIGGLIRTAFGSLPDFVVSGATATAILTDAVNGTGTAATDGAAPTGFTFSANTPTATVSVNLMAMSI